MSGPLTIRFAVSGTIKATQVWKITKPFLTIDGSTAPAPGITFEAPCLGAGCQTIKVGGGAHHVIVYSIRVRGLWKPGLQTPNNAETISAEGDMSPQAWPWGDPKYAGTRGLYESLFDRVIIEDAPNDSLASWCDVDNVSFLRFWIRDSYHPSTVGCGGNRPPGDPERRSGLTYAYGLWDSNGERQVQCREGVDRLDYHNNLVYKWQKFCTQTSEGTSCNDPYGLRLQDDNARECDDVNITDNLWIPGTANPASGCIVGDRAGCDAGGGGSGTNYAKCNPRVVTSKWFVSGNTGPSECTSLNALALLPRAFTLATVSWPQVLAEVGVVQRTMAEQARIDGILAALP